MITLTVRKGRNVPHLAQETSTQHGARYFNSTLCGRPVDERDGWVDVTGQTDGTVCNRCEALYSAQLDAVIAEQTVDPLDFPVVTGGTVTEGHARYCRENGHARHTFDGVVSPWCPRCGDNVSIAAVTVEEVQDAIGGNPWVPASSPVAEYRARLARERADAAALEHASEVADRPDVFSRELVARARSMAAHPAGKGLRDVRRMPLPAVPVSRSVMARTVRAIAEETAVMARSTPVGFAEWADPLTGETVRAVSY